MLVPFKSLPKDSRIWIFPSSKEIDIQKKAKIKERLIKFISDWTSHNKNLQASFELPYNRFIVVALNENIKKTHLFFNFKISRMPTICCWYFPRIHIFFFVCYQIIKYCCF